jgi:nucleoside-diphosphate-sugar epimerase
MKRVLISGAGGFIARQIARTLKVSNFYVIGISRNPKKDEYFDEIFQGTLGKSVSIIYDTYKIDTIIHCAYDKDGSDDINIMGTILWAEEAEKNCVNLQIFISSISAEENSISIYGQQKFTIEKWFISHNHLVFRPGLVIGNGGLFKKILIGMKKYPILPLINNGNFSTYITDINTLCNIIKTVITEEKPIERGKLYNIQQKTPVLLIDLMKEIRKTYNFSCIFIPVPYFFVLYILYVIEKINLFKLDINTNNLKGLKQNSMKVMETQLDYFDCNEIEINIMIKKLFDEQE